MRAASSMRGDERFGGGAEGQFADHDALLVARIEPGAHQHLAVAVVVLRDNRRSRRVGKSGKTQKLLPVQDGDLRLQELDEVVRKDLRRHADRYALGAHGQQHRHLGGQHHRLLVAAVVGRHELGDPGIEQRLFGEGRQAAFDVAHRGRPGRPVKISRSSPACR